MSANEETETVKMVQEDKEEAPAGLDECSFNQKIREHLQAPDAQQLMLMNREKFTSHQQLTAFWKKVEECGKSTNTRYVGTDDNGQAKLESVPVTEHQAVMSALETL